MRKLDLLGYTYKRDGNNNGLSDGRGSCRRLSPNQMISYCVGIDIGMKAGVDKEVERSEGELSKAW